MVCSAEHIKKKLYFVHQGLLSFVKKDLDILQDKYDTRAINNFESAFKNLPGNILGAWWCDIIFCWFASPRFLVPVLFGKLLKKKVIVISGGYDVASVPNIGYGSMRGGILAIIGKTIFKLADQVICISKSNLNETIRNAGVTAKKLSLIYHGFEHKNIYVQPRKENLVITVGRISAENLERKGLQYFLQAAHAMPDVQFAMIGKIDGGIDDRLRKSTPNNLTITGYLVDDDLKGYFSRALVYVQASMHEAFGCSVAEAMQFGCVPVVSDSYALPEVVGDAGYVFKFGDLDDMIAKIRLGLSRQEGLAEKAQERVKTMFSLDSRKNKLIQAIEAL